jgi:hypothetical protein
MLFKLAEAAVLNLLEKEVNGIEPSPSVRVPWLERRVYSFYDARESGHSGSTHFCRKSLGRQTFGQHTFWPKQYLVNTIMINAIWPTYSK